jgi:hypothetical protein
MAYGTAKKNNRVMLPISGGMFQTDDFPYGIWSSGDNGQNGSTETRGGSNTKSAGVRLMVGSEDGNYDCRSVKTYTEKSSIIQKISAGISNTSEGFVTISTFAKGLGALTVYNAKVIVIKNTSNIAAEVVVGMYDWRNDGGADGASDTTTDVANSVDRNAEATGGGATPIIYISFVLSANEFVYLPTSRFVSYTPYDTATAESAANAPAGDIDILPSAINSGNEYVDIHTFNGTTYFSGNDVQIAEDVAIGETDITVDDGHWFKVGDMIMINSEVMQIESISGAVLTVARGLLGSTEAAHSDDDDLRFFFGNELLPFDNGKCQTTQTGSFSQKGAFFGYGRTEDQKIDGIVPGSVAIGPFYERGGYLDFGLQNIKASDESGLAGSTQYTFHIVVDEYNTGGIDSTSTETAIAFTTDASDTTFNGSGNAVIPKIQARFDALFYDASSGLYNKKVRIALHNGDIRITSLSNHSETRVGIANVSGTTPFGVGRFPALSSSVPDVLGSPHGGGTTDTIVYGPASALQLEEIEDPVTGKTVKNKNAFLLDDGNGNLRFNDSVVGRIDYARGFIDFTHLPNAEFKISAESLSAHAGGIKHINNTYNSIKSIEARSINKKQDSEIELILLG